MLLNYEEARPSVVQDTYTDLIPGLERTDNGMKLTTWPDVTPINQKNYYTYDQAYQ